MQFKATVESIFLFTVQMNFIVNWKVNNMDKTGGEKKIYIYTYTLIFLRIIFYLDKIGKIAEF